MISKLSSTTIAVLTVLALLLSGCIQSEAPQDMDPTTKAQKMGFEQAEQDATFFIAGEAKGEVVQKITSVDGDTKDVRALRYKFTLRINERASNRIMANYDFKIFSPEGESPAFSEIIQTDQYGDLIWFEDIEFDVGKPNPQPALFLRKIEALENSSRQGQVSFIFQIYPWDEVLQEQEHPEFFYLRGSLRNAYRGEIQKLFSGEYNPYNRLKFLEGEKTALYVNSVNYELTAIPFNLMNNTAQNDAGRNRESLLENNEFPTKEEIEEYGIKAFDSQTNYVMMPEKDNPYLDDLLEANGLPPFRRESPTSASAFDGLKVDLVLNISLAQSYKKIGGFGERIQSSGRFKILPYIYAADLGGNAKHLLLNPEMGEMEATVDKENQLLNVHFRGILPYTPTAGRVDLALQITPMDNNASKYEVVEQLFTIGDYDSLIGRSKNLLRSPRTFREKFDFVNYAKQSSGYSEALENSQIRKAEPFNFSLAEVRFKTIQAGETANRRTVIFNVKTCINTVNFQNKVLEGKEFEVVARRFKRIEAESEDEMASNEGRKAVFSLGDYKDVDLFDDTNVGNKILADSRGCLNFLDEISHKYYQTERLIRRKYFIREKNDDQGFTKEMVLYLNPWDEKFGTLGTDSRSVSQKFIRDLNEREKIVPRFYIQDFRYETLRFRYEIDENMNLVVKKTVLFRAYPRVMRYSNVLQGINSIFPIRDGIYLLKVAYQKDYLDPAAEGIRLRSESYYDPQDGDTNYVEVKDHATIERVEDTGRLDENGEPIVNILRDERDAKRDEAYADSRNIHLDGSHEVVPPYDPSRKTSLSIVKKLVRVNSGAIVTPIEFSIDDLRLLRIRSQLFVQIEAINQTRLQIVNMASRKIEEMINLSKGNPQEIARLPRQEQRAIIKRKMDALDLLAQKIPDNIEYSKDDPSELIRVFEDPELIKAFSPFFSGGELSSIPKMLGLEPSDESLLEQNINDAFKTEEEFLNKLSYGVEAIRSQNTPAVDERHFEVETRRTEAGKEVRELFYKNPSPFYKVCGENWKGYNQCVEENTKDDPDFNPILCKCFDNMSKDYEDFETPLGSLLSELEHLESEIEIQKAGELLGKIRAKGRDFFKDLYGQEALTTLLLNDFTLAQAEADISDLDLLKDEVIPGVDIDRRTFVGPITFLYNTNGGALRPTDNLDEAFCVTDDCNSLSSDPLDKYLKIQNFDYERSPYHGSIAHFAGKHVDDFINGGVVEIGGKDVEIPSYNEFLENKKKEESVKALLSNFVEENNLKFISLSKNPDKPIRKFVCEHPSDVNFETGKCLEPYFDRVITKEELFKTHNKNRPSAIQGALKNFTDEALAFADKAGAATFETLTGFEGRSLPASNYTPQPDRKFFDEIVRKDHGGPQCQKKVVPVEYAKFSLDEQTKLCSLLSFGVYAENYRGLIDDLIKRIESGEVEPSDPKSPLAGLIKSASRGALYTEEAGQKTPLVGPESIKLYKLCVDQLNKGEGNEPIAIERKYRIEETGRYYYLGGKSLNINLGQNISISHKRDSNKLHKYSFDSLWGWAIPKPLSGYGYSYSRGEGVSANESLGITQGTFLVMQNAEFDVELTKYEQCLVVRWTEGFMSSEKGKNFFFYNYLYDHMNSQNPDSTLDGMPYQNAMAKRLSEGLMICSGKIEDEPVAVRETYYYFTQHFTEGDMQDRADIHNHPWLLSLRGVREFETFLMATHSDHDSAAESIEKQFVQTHELIGMNKLAESDIAGENLSGSTTYKPWQKKKRNSWPIKQLIQTYKMISPTFPGLYTQLDRQEYQVEQWPWEGSLPGDKFEQRKLKSECVYEEVNHGEK